MSLANRKSYKAPFESALVDIGGKISSVWLQFFVLISNALSYLSEEISFKIVNNTAVAAEITGLSFDKRFISAAYVDYLIQRITSSTSKVQLGILRVTYNPDTDAWSQAEYGTSGPDAAGITFSITSDGQMKYTSSNLAGTEEISRIVFRIRSMQAKHSSYSKVG